MDFLGAQGFCGVVVNLPEISVSTNTVQQVDIECSFGIFQFNLRLQISNLQYIKFPPTSASAKLCFSKPTFFKTYFRLKSGET